MTRRLGDLAAAVGGSLSGDGNRPISGVATLSGAGPADISFLTNAKYRAAAERSAAAALLVPAGFEMMGRDLVVVDEPYLALATLLAMFYPVERPAAGVHPSAMVGEAAEVDATAHVGPGAVIGVGAQLGPRVVVHGLASIGAGSRIGADSVIHPHAVLYPGVLVGERCVIHAGVVVGADGFGYATHRGRHVKVPQVGRVVLEDDVEIGPNTTVDRALLEETRIGEGTKIDNLVMVAHNVRVGKACLLVAQSGIAGSTVLGDGVVLAGQAGVSGHLRVASGARVAAKSAVFKNVPEGQQVAGIPATEAGQWRRQQALLSRLQEMQRRLRALEEGAGTPGATTREEE